MSGFISLSTSTSQSQSFWMLFEVVKDVWQPNLGWIGTTIFMLEDEVSYTRGLNLRYLTLPRHAVKMQKFTSIAQTPLSTKPIRESLSNIKDTSSNECFEHFYYLSITILYTSFKNFLEHLHRIPWEGFHRWFGINTAGSFYTVLNSSVLEFPSTDFYFFYFGGLQEMLIQCE